MPVAPAAIISLRRRLLGACGAVLDRRQRRRRQYAHLAAYPEVMPDRTDPLPSPRPSPTRGEGEVKETTSCLALLLVGFA